jgi:hypothetical protein
VLLLLPLLLLLVCCTAVTACDQQPCQLNACFPDDTAWAYRTICNLHSHSQHTKESDVEPHRTRSEVGQLADGPCALPTLLLYWKLPPYICSKQKYQSSKQVDGYIGLTKHTKIPLH